MYRAINYFSSSQTTLATFNFILACVYTTYEKSFYCFLIARHNKKKKLVFLYIFHQARFFISLWGRMMKHLHVKKIFTQDLMSMILNCFLSAHNSYCFMVRGELLGRHLHVIPTSVFNVMTFYPYKALTKCKDRNDTH